ncbi:MAG: hypothetical protein N2Z79_02310, partial [Candidatus Omnitrophica bacterium]|nr:hypothetical protein [Candidatus Omnitrophota bacterium]
TLEYDFGSSVLHLQLAELYIKKGALDLAVDELKLALKYSPQDLELHYLLTLIYSLQNKYDLAKKTFEEFLKTAIELHPKTVSLYHTLAGFYIQQNAFKEAENVYNLILKQ